MISTMEIDGIAELPMNGRRQRHGPQRKINDTLKRHEMDDDADGDKRGAELGWHSIHEVQSSECVRSMRWQCHR